MIREEFDEKVKAQFAAFKDTEMAKLDKEIFDNAYCIVKMVSLKDYLLDRSDDKIEDLYPYAETVLNDLYAWEWEYDEPMWVTWEAIDDMVNDFIREASE